MLNRRCFFHYAIGSASTVLGCHWVAAGSAAANAETKELDLDQFCLEYPYNSRCESYLPGVEATAPDGEVYSLEVLLSQSQAGDRIPATGLENLTYLVMTDGPELAAYGISVKCIHLGCTVNWDTDEQKFICPCHGSRFDSLGNVMNGPARDPLRLVAVATNQDRIGLVDQSPEATPRN